MLNSEEAYRKSLLMKLETHSPSQTHSLKSSSMMEEVNNDQDSIQMSEGMDMLSSNNENLLSDDDADVDENNYDNQKGNNTANH